MNFIAKAQGVAPRDAIELLWKEGEVYMKHGKFSAAHMLLQAALTKAQSLGEPAELATAYCGLGLP